MPEEEEEEQEIENLFEKIMEENFPNLVKEIDIQVQEAQSHKEDGPEEEHTRHIIIKLPMIKDKERILKAAREKETVTYTGIPIRLSVDFSKESFQGKKELERSIQSHERQGPTSKITVSSKAII